MVIETLDLMPLRYASVFIISISHYTVIDKQRDSLMLTIILYGRPLWSYCVTYNAL